MLQEELLLAGPAQGFWTNGAHSSLQLCALSYRLKVHPLGMKCGMLVVPTDIQSLAKGEGGSLLMRTHMSVGSV